MAILDRLDHLRSTCIFTNDLGSDTAFQDDIFTANPAFSTLTETALAFLIAELPRHLQDTATAQNYLPKIVSSQPVPVLVVVLLPHPTVLVKLTQSAFQEA